MQSTKTSLQDQLKAALQQRLSAGIPLPNLISFTLSIHDLDLVDWLSAQTAFPKLYWQARGNPNRYGGIGAAITLEHDSNETDVWQRLEVITRDNPEVAFWGGQRFDADRPTSPEWQEFGQQQIVLPRFVVEQTPTKSSLRCNIITTEAPSDLLEQIETEIDSLIFDCPPMEGQAAFEATPHEIPSKEIWQSSVQEITNGIERSELQKTVLARRMDITCSEPANPFLFIRHFHAMQSPAYYFCFQPSAQFAFVGSSPECLYQRKQHHIASESLAGTRRRGDTPEADKALRQSLETSRKDLHEHHLVADHVRRALDPLCDSLSDATAPSILRLVLVQHLLSKITGKLKSTTSDQALVDALHPTPAVGGVPTDAALQTIRSLEPFDRGWYAAPFGMLSRDSVELTVAIRSGLLHGNTLSLYCGAGIVDASDPTSEWEETESKFDNFLHVIHVE